MNFLGRKPNLHKLPVGRPPIEYLKKKETFSVSTPVYLKLAYKRICESLGLNPNKQTVNMITAFCLQHLSTLKDQDSCIFLVNGKCEAEGNPKPISQPDILICMIKETAKLCQKYQKTIKLINQAGT